MEQKPTSVLDPGQVTVTCHPQVLGGDWVVRAEGMIVFSDPDPRRAAVVARRHYGW